MNSFVAQLKDINKPMFQNSNYAQHSVPPLVLIMDLVMVYYKASWTVAGVSMHPG